MKNIAVSVLTLLLSTLSSVCDAQAIPNKHLKECSLKGRKILVTAPENYSVRLCDAIKKKGGKPILLSTIETTINPDDSAILEVLQNQNKYGWVALSSRKAIDAFCGCAIKHRYSIDSLKVCTMGKDTEYMQQQYRVKAAITPKEPSPEGIVKALATIPGTNGQTIAVVAPNIENLTEPDVIPNFLSRLKDIGMEPVKIEGYITRPTTAHSKKEIEALFHKRRIDAIIFSSATETEGLAKLAGGNNQLNTVMVACFGPYTAANVKKMGVKVAFVGTNYSSFEAFVDELCTFINHQN